MSSISPAPAGQTTNTAPRILVVDDESPICELLETYLSTRGYAVFVASTGEEALRIARENMVHLFLIDFLLPDCDGLELITRLQNIKSRRPVILMTGFGADKQLLERALAAGAADCISKTSPLTELVQKIEAALNPSKKPLSTTDRTGTNLPPASGLAAPESNRPALHPNASRFGIQTATTLLSARHPNLASTASRAVALAEAVSAHLQFTPAEAQNLIHAAAFHDVALISWNRPLLDSWFRAQGKLNAADWNIVRKHPEQSQQMLGFSPELTPAGEIIRAHHEHWDGTGYPDGLKGTAIPWPARLLSVIVAYCNRLFVSPTALPEIRHASGTVFDKAAVDAVAACAAEVILPATVREVHLTELAPGMILANDFLNPNGDMILAKDKELTSAWINKIQNIHSVTPLNPVVQIQC